MKILLATTEAVPFCKTGGLGDVCGSLPVELAKLGHRPVVILPAFRQVLTSGLPLESTGVEFDITIGKKKVHGSFLKSKLPGSDVVVYFVKQDDYFDRDDLYGENGIDYKDNCERFVFFCRAATEAIRLLKLETELVHCNDWQTGLIPAYLKTEYRGLPDYEQIASLFTIHNLHHQGNFWHWDMLLTGLDWKYFNWRQMEFFGNLNLLKTGLVFADALSTVSPRYAEEIQSTPLGCGLEGILQHRSETLTGIINGVDYREWNPAVDTELPTKYDVENVTEGKAACKQSLQRELGLPIEPDVPLIATIGRLADQKGCDLIAQVMQDRIQTSQAQWVILGTGDPKYHELFSSIAERHPDRAAVLLEFSNPLAHRIEAAADIFLMPSRYEPCGLNQLYSLRYGTVPVVRATGGLADTIENTTEASIAAGAATGFAFREYSTLALAETLDRAFEAFANKGLWQQLIETGMRQDWSWAHSSREYDLLYRQTVARLKRTVTT